MYLIETSDGTMGHVRYFMMDNQSWAIRQLVIKTGRWLSVREVQMTPHSPRRASGIASHGQKQ
jgi:hypothetical protein